MYARSLKGSIAPKGQQNIAQGIALGNDPPHRASLKGKRTIVETVTPAKISNTIKISNTSKIRSPESLKGFQSL